MKGKPVYVMGNKISVTNYQCCIRSLGDGFDGFRMVVISDLHANLIGGNNSVLIDRINRLSPDAVIIAGDMVSDDGRNMEETAELISIISGKYDTYYGCGNHEMKLRFNPFTEDIYHKYRKRLRETDVHFLSNKSAYIYRGDSRVKVCGLNIGLGYYAKFWRTKKPSVNYINRLVGNSHDNNEPVILIAHNPLFFDTYAKWGADVVLSGHMHGGIVILPVIGGIISPTYALFPHYDFGEYTSTDAGTGHVSKMFISRGLGSHTIPLRINNKPEIMVVELCRKRRKG